jgi:23S rRNA pseudouridine1911/1915/1917 synthase
VNQDRIRHFSYSISSEDRHERIDTFLASQIEGVTRSRAQGLIREGHVRVNNRPPKSSYRLRTGDVITLTIPPARPYHLDPEPVAFSLIHEDDAIIVLNKPAGLVVHPAPGHDHGTLVHGLLKHCERLSGIGGVLRPGIVHRLDKDTSGVMVVAKNDRAHESLGRQFKAGNVEKKYLAFVYGVPKETRGKIDFPIARHREKRKEMSVQPERGKRALTLWEKCEVYGNQFSSLSITLKTGRTHQIRVHMSFVGYPILGDPVYGRKRKQMKRRENGTSALWPLVQRQMLHASNLGFLHPESAEYVEFQAPMPEDMVKVQGALRSI